MRRELTITLALAVAAAPAVQSQHRVLGSQVRIELAGAASFSGELLAAREDTLWVLPDDGTMRVVSLMDVRGTRVPQGGFTSKQALTWTIIGGVVTGALLTHACSQVTTGCGSVLPVTMVPWLAVGGLSAALSGSPTRDVDVRALAPYARFPQGMPEGFVPSLVPRN